MPRSPRKTPMKKRPTKKKQTHPSYKDMITEAIMEDKKWTKGSSRQSIAKYIVSNYEIDENTVRQKLRPALRRLTDVEEGPVLIQHSVGCFKLNPDWKEEWKKKKIKKKSNTPPRKKGKKVSYRRKKDKNAPKKAHSPYIFYAASVRNSIRKKYPDATFGDISKKIAAKWKKVPESKREKFKVMAAEDKKRYERELKAYKKKKKRDSSSTSSDSTSSTSTSSSSSSSSSEEPSSSSSSSEEKKKNEKSEKSEKLEKLEKSEKAEKEKAEKGREKSKTDLRKLEKDSKNKSSSTSD